ncbi:hypothetical protein EsDP_00006786 [Epichloe bromicola]|uniref:Pectinesterase n=1 Tax=Epichloe bromicola TaxID=79588 RepID=A0ABQ0CYP6_9HYPO
MLSFLTVVLALASATAVLASRTCPPKGALVVGKGGQYETIQAAVDALQPTEKEQVIFIYPGTYREQVSIKSLPGPLKIYGYTTSPGSYAANQVTIVAGHSQKDKRTNDLTATLRVATSHFRLYNLNVVNDFGVGSQALALSAKNTDQGYYACSFIGHQDTVLSQEARQLFHHCHIQGATDFIFGQRGGTWFEKGTISVLPVKTGYVTASGRASDDSDSYYVFNRTRIEAAPGAHVKKGSYFLARPWAPYSRVAYQFCWMSDVINGSGWHVWKAGDERIDHVSFGEFENKGPGALGERAWFAKKLKKRLEIGDILGEDHESAYYFDSSFVASDSD